MVTGQPPDQPDNGLRFSTHSDQDVCEELIVVGLVWIKPRNAKIKATASQGRQNTKSRQAKLTDDLQTQL
jgi:hypothetical protein